MIILVNLTEYALVQKRIFKSRYEVLISYYNFIVFYEQRRYKH